MSRLKREWRINWTLWPLHEDLPLRGSIVLHHEWAIDAELVELRAQEGSGKPEPSDRYIWDITVCTREVSAWGSWDETTSMADVAA